MARKDAEQDQAGLPGIPQAPKRQVIKAIEDLCLERDEKCAERTVANDAISEINDKIQEHLVKRDLPRYTYKDASGVLQDVERTEKLRKKKSASNPKPKSKKVDEVQP